MDQDKARTRSKAILTIKFMLFTASIIPSVLSGAMFLADGVMRWQDYSMMFFGLFIAQLGGDYLYYNFTHFHTDPRDSHTKLFAGWKPFFADTWLAGKRTLYAGLFCLSIDALLGVYFIIKIGWALALFIVAGGAIALLFTPLMLMGLKEITVFLAFGPLAMTGMAFAMTGRIRAETIVASIPVGLWVAIVAHLKSANIKSLDERTGVVTLSTGTITVSAMAIISYAVLIAGVILDYLPPWSLLGLLSVPLMIRVVIPLFGRGSTIKDYLTTVIISILALSVGGMLMAAGYLL